LAELEELLAALVKIDRLVKSSIRE